MNIGSVMSPHGGGRKSTLAVEARALVQQAARRGVLCSLIPEGGFPYGSLVEVLPLPDGDLIIFLSRLAEHQHYIEADARHPSSSRRISPTSMLWRSARHPGGPDRAG